MKVKLEFSEDQQAFHNRYGNLLPHQTENGYAVLGEIDDHESILFTRMIHNKYHDAHLTLATMQQEFNDFTKK